MRLTTKGCKAAQCIEDERNATPLRLHVAVNAGNLIKTLDFTG
jgi:hypothetical protein